ncbi:MAG TPA: ABC transporter ATP-binding protein [Polyangiaceae bacterium]|nr:ABC transporter ATP-binding protein [Polyangiaceae bacterium]
MSEPAALSVRGLFKSFGALPVTRGVNLELLPGARVGLIGPNGAGKTTLIHLLSGVLKADAGQIQLSGISVERWPAERRVRHGLARTHQINTLLGETCALDNVAIAIAERERIAWRTVLYRRRWQACREEARARLDEIGIGSAAQQPVRELAYGEQRLLEIAIALALRPRVLLLDEPAAGVPSGEVSVIHEALARLPAEMAILLIEHDMDLVFRFATEIVVLVQGSVLSQGSPEQTRADPRVRAAYLGRSLA